MHFDDLYSRLNKAQKMAVDTIEGPVMVIAGPGTGKTTILTLRIANILKKTDTPPSGILAITFTDAGVKAMKAKLRDIIGSQADEVRIHTFHSFAASVMAEFPEHFIDTNGFAQMADIEADELVRGILEEEQFAPLRPLGKPDLYIHSIISAISEAKREALSPDAIHEYVREEIERLKGDEASISTRGISKGELKADVKKKIERLEKTALFGDIYARYEEKKKESRLMDYDDLILNVVLAFGRDELLLRLVQEKFLYLLVDEHQDTNDSQNLMVRLIADFFENPNLFVVGDEKQAIYRFQGASVENFLKFEKAWPAMKVISLEENYRSHQHILDASFSMIESNYAENEHKKLRVKLTAGNGKASRFVDLVQPKDRAEAEGFLASELARIQKDEPEKTVAIISRSNKDVDRIVRLAEERGIVVSAERSIDIFSHPVGEIFFALAAFVRDPLDVESLGKTIVAGLWGMRFDDAVPTLQKLRKGQIDEVVREIPGLSRIMTLSKDDSPIYFLMQLAELSGFSMLVAADPAYVEIWRGVINLAEKIVKQYGVANPLMLLEKLLAYKMSSEGRRIKVSVGVKDSRISVMTAHGSKGLEFDYVFVPYATEESWLPKKRSAHFVLPSKRLEKDGDDVRDARRLFYVALTRAREHVVIISPTEDVVGDLNTPLRFVDELDVKVINRVVLNGDHCATHNGHHYAKPRQAKLVDFAKNTLLERGLSVTALNHFLKCPAEFLFKSILRLPEAPSPTAEKGIAMHAAFNRIWKMEEAERTEETIIHTINATSSESVNASYLRAFEKETILRDIAKTAPHVAHCLVPHFHTQGEIDSEAWSETTFEATYDGTIIQLRLHGKLDVVISTPSELLVFDYKTKKKMSENEIKGLTANSDGAYFRQLVFYKTLLTIEAKKEGKSIVPSLVFLTPDEKQQCEIRTLAIEDADVTSVHNQIQSLVESVWSGELASINCDEEKCEYCALLKLAIND